MKITASSLEALTTPVGGVEQPDFLNQVLAVETDLAPGQLLALAKQVEALAAVAQGVQILRVHDVAETRQALAVWEAASGGVPPETS